MIHLHAWSTREEKSSLEGVQNKPPHIVPLRHVGYFKLKTINAQKNQKKILISP